jgi:hypothetical protein
VLSSGIIDLAVGLIFVFGVTAALASAITELITRFTGLRGAYLLQGLRELVDSGQVTTDLSKAEAAYDNVKTLMLRRPSLPAAPAAAPPESALGALLGGPILANQGMAGQIESRKLTLAPPARPGQLPKMMADPKRGLWRQRRSLPSYISAQSFSEAVIDLVVPNAAGQTTMETIAANVDRLPEGMSTLKSSLQALVKSAGNDINGFRTAVERWYDDHMDRVSGWYKRYAAKITLAVGAVLVILLNINVLTIGRTLYTNSTVGTAVSQVAAKGADCPGSQTGCLGKLEGQLSAAAAGGLPIGWGTVRDCLLPGAHCNWWEERGIFSRHGNSGWQLVLVLVGFLLTIIALVPGARFWFGLLSKIGSLRTTGPKPAAGS